MNFLRSEIGPRGECARAIRAELLKQEEQINEVLLPFGQTARTHIREIYMKHKFYVPSPEYTKYLRITDANDKFKENYSRLQDRDGPMRKSIYEGLLKKHGEAFDFEGEFAALASGYSSKMEEAERELAVLRELLHASKEYHQYMRVKAVFEPFFRQWGEADSSMGKENLKTGAQFEEKVSNTMLPYLISRERADPHWPNGSKNIEVFTNASWIPRSLGEIDIALGYRDEAEDRYFIFALIECKSRLFDLREAFKQVSLDDQEPLNKGPTMQQLKEMKKIRQQANNSKSKKKGKSNSEADKTAEK
jgi:hypothetical protein